MTSIRPSMPGIQQTGPLQNVQRAAPQPAKTEAPKEAPKPEASTIAKDENNTKTFDDTPIADVNIEGLFESADTQETEETDDTDAADGVGGADETDSADDADDVADDVDVDAPDEAEGPEEPEAPEVEEEEEEEGGPDWDESEGGEGSEGPEAPERHIDVTPLLEIVSQLRDLQKFRIEETWAIYGG